MPRPHAPRESLRTTAERVLEAVLNTRRQQQSALRLFPEQTRPAALILARELGRGMPGVQLLQDSLGHTWVRTGRSHLDLTLSESPYRTALYVRWAPPPSAQGEITPLDVAQLSLELPEVVADEALLRPYLDAPRGKQASTPRVRVEDRWLGMDVLACGHLLVGTTSRARFCPYCSPLARPSSTFRVTASAAALHYFRGLSDEERGELVERLSPTEERPGEVGADPARPLVAAATSK